MRSRAHRGCLRGKARRAPIDSCAAPKTARASILCGQRARLPVLLGALLAGTCLGTAALAQDATWLAAPGSSDFNTAANWDPASVPTGIAAFGGSNTTTLTFSGSRNVDAFQFNGGAPAYTFNLSGGFGVQFNGDGIVNASSNAPTFNLDTGFLNFDNVASAGNAVINVNAGTLTFLNNSTAGNAQITAGIGTTVDFSTATGPGGLGIITAGSIAGAGNYLLGNSQFIVGSNNLSTTVDGVISGAGASLNKVGTGTLTLNGNNTYGGGTVLNGGTLSLGSDQALSTGTLIAQSGTLDVQDTRIIANNITLLGDIAISVVGAGTGTLTGIITSGAPAGFTKTGTGTLVLTGNNSYAGATNVDAGVLQIDNASALPQTTDMSVNTGATLQIGDGLFADINSLANGPGGGGTVRIGTSDPTTVLALGFFNGGATTTFGGSLIGPGNLEIDGGSLTLTGASSIGGDLLVCECATLTISGAGASFTATGSGVLAFAPGSEIDGTLNVLNGATFSTDNLTIGGSMTADGTNTTVTASGLTFVGTSITAANLTISGGAVMNSLGGAVVENPFEVATAVVTGQNSVWNVSNGLAVGNFFAGGAGALTVSAGGVVNVTGGTTIGADPFFGLGPSIATVTGAGSALNTDTLQIGQTSCICGDLPGTLTVADGGRVTATGPVTIATVGILNLGTGGLAGSIVAPAITNDGQIVANFTDTSTLAANIDGTGTLSKSGPGNLILTGNSSYTGATTVNAGKLTVNGSITSGVTVNAAELGGSGTVGPVTLNSSTLSPGNSIGTITINGNLTFVGAGNYLVELSPATADRTNVNGAATLSGTVRAAFAPGVYTPRSYTILHATGGLNGTTFGGLVGATVPPAFSSRLEYTSTDVLLTLSLDFTKVTGLNRNQQAVANTIQNAVNAGLTLPTPFFALASLPNGSLQNALTQASGEIATGSAAAGFRSMDLFLNLMLDPFLETRIGDGSTQGRALGFAPEADAALPAAVSAYAGLPTKAPPRASFDQRWTVWGAAAGGAGTFKGDAIVGSSNLDVRGGIFAAGIDYRLSPDSVIGIAFAGGTQTFGLDGIQASGRSNSVQGGVYGSTRWGNAYLSAAAAYGRHDLSTERNVAFTGLFDRLTADYRGDSFGGRIEGGYRFAAESFGFTPYAAVQALRFQTPSFGELDRTGIVAFALNYAGQSWNDTRTELGARADYRIMIEHALLTLRGRAAWAHDFDTGRAINAAFQALPGFGFSVIGASPAPDSALVSAGAELKFRNGVALRARFDGEFANRSNVYAGSGGVYVSW